MGIIFDILRCSVNDGPGLRTVVFLKGCPLKCLWCHNPESQSRKPELLFNFEKCTGCGKCSEICTCHIFQGDVHKINREKCTACGKCVNICAAGALEVKGRECSVDEVLREVRKDKKFYEKTGGGVTISGGEPFMQPEFLKEILIRCREEGIHTAIETSGSTSFEMLEQVLPLTDLFLWDYKTTEYSAFFTGIDKERILDNLRYVLEHGACVRLRCPVVPGVSDNEVHMEAIARLSGMYDFEGVDILPYHNMGVFKSLQLGRTPWDTGIPNMEEEKKRWIFETLTKYGCRKFKIL